jgi:hypothetical protein
MSGSGGGTKGKASNVSEFKCGPVRFTASAAARWWSQAGDWEIVAHINRGDGLEYDCQVAMGWKNIPTEAQAAADAALATLRLQMLRGVLAGYGGLGDILDDVAEMLSEDSFAWVTPADAQWGKDAAALLRRLAADLTQPEVTIK